MKEDTRKSQNRSNSLTHKENYLLNETARRERQEEENLRKYGFYWEIPAPYNPAGHTEDE